MPIQYLRSADLGADDLNDVLRRSGQAERRPVDDPSRIRKMLENSNLVVVAKDADTGAIVGVARSVTDFSYCCYLSDLAVDKLYQGQGIGRRLIEETRRIVGPESMCLLLSAPDAMGFYKAIGMPRADNAFLYSRER
jgi:GNAT superfamily N-acetyltransferase